MRLTLVNDDSELVDSWDLSEYDLTKAIARTMLMVEVADQIKWAEREPEWPACDENGR